MNTRKTQSTQNEFDRAITPALEVGSHQIDTIRTEVTHDVNLALHATKLVLSEAGVMRVLIQNGGKVRMGDKPSRAEAIRALGGKRSYSVATSDRLEAENQALRDGYDTPSLDSVFACGDYWMPLSISFAVRANKVLDNSQLVDGPSVTQRVSKSPRTVDVNFSIERRETPSNADNSAYVEATAIRYSQDETTDKQAIYKLTRVLADLFENNDVFQVKNPVLNDEIGISWAVMTDYRFSPDQGSTFGSVSFTLQEVNVNDPLLYQSDTQVQSGGVPTSKQTANG